ncbi:MAG: PEP-CTERM sorting domain-containing protein [Phycisphaeraceae bacterium]
MFLKKPASMMVLAGVSALALTPAALAADLGVFNANQFDLNGFSFGGLATIDTSGGFLSIDSTEFGGAGSDVTIANFDAVDALLEVTLTVDPLNVADNLRVVLVDDDGPGFGEEYQFFVSLAGVTPGQQVTLSQPLLSPGPVFRQAAFGQLDGDMIQNYGLRQIQLQSEFGSANRLKVDILSVKVVDPGDPTILALTPTTWNSAPNQFTFGSFSVSGAVDATGESFVIDADVTTDGDFPDTSFGGLGFTQGALDFDASMAELVILAKVLPNNEASQFRVLMSDLDGDDSAPGQGSDDYIFNIQTASLSDTEFTEIIIPLGTGSESLIDEDPTFGFTNFGNSLQDFGLTGFQIQADGDETLDRLNIEVASVIIREAASGLLGDFNGDTVVDAADVDLLTAAIRDGSSDTQFDLDGLNGVDAADLSEMIESVLETFFGDSNLDGEVDLIDLSALASSFGLTAGWADGNFNTDTVVDLIDLSLLASNFGSSASVPEPTTAALLGLAGLGLLRRRA